MALNLISKIRKSIASKKLIFRLSVLIIMAVLVIMCAFFFIVNYLYLNNVKKIENEENQAIIKQISEELQAEIYRINDFSLSIYSNPTINSAVIDLRKSTDDGDLFNRINLKNIIYNQLIIYQDTNEAVSCIQIYVKGNGSPITVGNLSTMQVSDITREYENKYMDSVFETGGTQQIVLLDSNYIIFTRALGDFNDYNKDKELNYTIVLVMSDSYINKIMDKLYYSNYSQGKTICLINRSGQIVKSTKKDYIGQNTAELGMESLAPGISMQTFGTGKALCALKFSDKIQQYIMVSTNIEEIDLSINAFRISFFLILLFVGMVIIIILIMVTNYLGKPVQKLVNSLKGIGINSNSIEMVDVGDGGNIALSFNKAIARLENLINANYQHIINEKNARIAILQLQINPHFIFNTLDTISWAIYKEDKKECIKMIASLGNIMRYTTYNYTKYVRMKDEIKITEDYLYFHKITHKDFKEYVLVDPTLENFKMPCLLIQPIVENACRHGLKERKNGRLSVVIRRSGNAVEIIIADNGSGIPQERIDKIFIAHDREEDEHIGIRNVKERIHACFGETSRFEITSRCGFYTRVYMLLPTYEVDKC